jgi:hypothetical protein
VRKSTRINFFSNDGFDVVFYVNNFDIEGIFDAGCEFSHRLCHVVER